MISRGTESLEAGVYSFYLAIDGPVALSTCGSEERLDGENQGWISIVGLLVKGCSEEILQSTSLYLTQLSESKYDHAKPEANLGIPRRKSVIC